MTSVGVPARELPELVPRLRGWLHLGASPLALVGGVVLALVSPDWPTQLASAAFTLSALVNFLASAALHLGTWSPRALPTVRRLDHASIFVLIAGSYTPFTVLMLSGPHQLVLLVLAWGGAAAGVAFRLVWSTAPRWVYTLLYLALGWGMVLFLHDFAVYTPVVVPVLLAAGGALYTVGGVVYALRRPNPSAGWFGFHEVFHALTVTAFACQYAGVLVAAVARR